ncbi:hypothetical protein EYF80_021706 [Liparis tanakae]|uniref:Uncharacterized protein n=1 Tax=Liparis tanakae TaxID=230148 RepID=A0A4Z2HR57_9TELE|nr:hypothetical protein EYF80_021706 [Liparis tanakae]
MNGLESLSPELRLAADTDRILSDNKEVTPPSHCILHHCSRALMAAMLPARQAQTDGHRQGETDGRTSRRTGAVRNRRGRSRVEESEERAIPIVSVRTCGCMQTSCTSVKPERKKEGYQSSRAASSSCVCDMLTAPWSSASCSLALALSFAMLQVRSSSELGPSGLSHFPDLWVAGCTRTLSAALTVLVHG